MRTYRLWLAIFLLYQPLYADDYPTSSTGELITNPTPNLPVTLGPFPSPGNPYPPSSNAQLPGNILCENNGTKDCSEWDNYNLCEANSCSFYVGATQANPTGGVSCPPGFQASVTFSVYNTGATLSGENSFSGKTCGYSEGYVLEGSVTPSSNNLILNIQNAYGTTTQSILCANRPIAFVYTITCTP